MDPIENTPENTRRADRVAPLSQPVVVVGAGPAGLTAAQVLAEAGIEVHCFDAMPTAGRKFLLAGRGGLNLTHSEPLQTFVGRYGSRRSAVEPWLTAFGPDAVREWARSLGVETFVGTSGRVFPTEMKAAPLMRAWLRHLRAPADGRPAVQFHMRHRWTGWDAQGSLMFETPAGAVHVQAAATVLALGGASWPRLGSDGAWAAWLPSRGLPVAPLQPANCGFDVEGGWTPFFVERFAGQPFKTVAVTVQDETGGDVTRRGEFVATATGVEGSVVYAVSSLLRDRIAREGRAVLRVDLLPDHNTERVRAEVRHPRGSRSLASHLKSRLGLDGIKSAALFEVLGREGMADADRLAAAIKALPLVVAAPRPVDEAISTAGGVLLEGLDAQLMATAMPGVFVAGEMLDWEAPTGGYLLTAALASGRVAGQGAAAFVAARGA